MLKRLYIKDYAIIDEIEVEFDEGLNILTGETGAGKSIIIGALGILLGESCSTDFIRKGGNKIIVEGVFTIQNRKKINDFLLSCDITDVSDEIIIRREISQSGKSRGYIDDTPVKLQAIKEFGNMLVDLHGQHEHQSILKKDFYFELLDGFGNLTDDARTVKELFLELKDYENKKKKMLKELQDYREQKELMEFQLHEINKVNPQKGEDEELEREIRINENLEKIWELSNLNYEALYGENDSVIDRLNHTLHDIEKLIHIDDKFEEIKNYIESAIIEIKESANLLSKYTDRSSYNPEMLEEARQRHNAIYTLKRKYKGTIEDILKKRDMLQEKLDLQDRSGERIKEIENKIKETVKKLGETAYKLSEKRCISAKKMSMSITNLLQTLGMKSGILSIAVDKKESDDGIIEINGQRYTADADGIDRIEFLAATNKGEDLKPLSRIASLGEMSRVVLAIKSVLADSDSIPVLIFDEIDVGISGRIASVIAKKLKQISSFHQVLCITHLPQIASAGNVHYSVQKREKEDRVFTAIEKLSYKQRVDEIAKLLGGEKTTNINLKNAEELLKEGKAL